jgi:hypothetical protein
MSADNLTGQYISDTYQKVLTLSDNGEYVTDGTGSIIPSLPITASYSLTASYTNFAGSASVLTPGNKTIQGDLYVAGKLTADELHTTIVSASIIYKSGSTKFGNTLDDRHEFTGSLFITASGIFINGIGVLTNANTSSFITDAQTGSMSVLSASYASSGYGIFSGSFSGSFEGDGSGLTGIVASASPAGPNTSVQFKDGGVTSGSSQFTFNKSTGGVTAVSYTGSFKGNGSQITGVVSASYAATASYALSQPIMKVGIVPGTLFINNPKQYSVVFPKAFPNNGYAVTVSGEVNRSWTISGKSANGFTINAGSNAAFTVNVFWIAIQSGSYK